MKRVILSCAILAAIAISCAEQAGVSYHIKGSTSNEQLEGATVYLSEYANKEKIDSAVISGGVFEMKGEVEHPSVFMVTSGNKSALALTGDTANITYEQEMTVEQDEQMATILEMSDSLKTIQNSMVSYMRDPEVDFEAKKARYAEINAIMDDVKASYLDANGDNLAGAYIVITSVNSTETLEELDSLIAKAPLAEKMYYVKRNRANKENALKTAVGEQFVDFNCTDIEGNPAKLSDYVGKGDYVLVDFWASWCGPCRAEMPNLKDVYQAHKDNGLVLLGVNVWDKKDACMTAIEEEQMTWSILYASDTTDATDSYGILGIPTIILFAPDGKIVDRTARGPKIMELIDSIYK